MSAWTWGWLVWLAYFGVLETAALIASHRARKAGKADPRDTLSEHVWAFFGINVDGYGIDHDANAWSRVRRVILAGFLVWLGIHFLGGGLYL